MKPDLVFPFPTRYELVFHDRIPRDLPTWELPAAVRPDPQQELADAPIVEVRPASERAWIGIFFAEETPHVRGTLVGWPDERSLCFFGGGGAYVVDSADPTRVTVVGSGPLQQCYVHDDPRVVLFVEGWTGICAYGAEGLLWRSDRLASDDVAIVGVAEGAISCTGFFGGRRDAPFEVDLATGEQREPSWER